MVSINFSKRDLRWIVPLVLVLVIGFGIAYGGSEPSVMGHSSGEIRLTDDTASCDSQKEGTLRWTGINLDICDGLGWNSIYTIKDGSAQDRAGITCKTLHDDGFNNDGTYWIDPTGGTTNDAFQAYCDMNSDGGGWTLVVGIGNNYNHQNIAAVTSGNLISSTGKGKFSDATINLIKSGSDPAYRFTCASTTGYFQGSCVFAATTQASGDCTSQAYDYPPSSYATAEYSQGGIVTLADGSSGTANRLVYGYTGLTGCNTGATGWYQSGTVYVR